MSHRRPNGGMFFPRAENVSGSPDASCAMYAAPTQSLYHEHGCKDVYHMPSFLWNYYFVAIPEYPQLAKSSEKTCPRDAAELHNITGHAI